jgi:hypothetical protein
MALAGEESVPGPADPVIRLCEIAGRLGITVAGGADAGGADADGADADGWPDESTAAVVSFGEHIALNPGLDEDLRTDVLAMALIVAAVMGEHATGHPCAITAPGGLVLISQTRAAGLEPGPGRLATLLARKCGRDTPSAAFAYTVIPRQHPPDYCPAGTVQTAPVSAPETSAAYLAIAPLV